MKVVFCVSDKPRERILADAMGEGVRKHGDEYWTTPLVPEPQPINADVACMVGVKSRDLFRLHQNNGTHVLYLDKGYVRDAADSPVKLWKYWRVALDDHQPTDRLLRPHPGDARWDALQIVLPPWRKKGSHVLIAGSSEKYHQFYGMHHPTKWAQRLVRALRGFTDREIVYRPKPSWRDAVPIADTRYSRGEESIADVLKNCHVMVTHGSNAVFEAQLAGIPTITLGPAITAPISSRGQDAVEDPYLANYTERHQLLNNLAWWQWTLPEMASGEAWEFLKKQVYG